MRGFRAWAAVAAVGVLLAGGAATSSGGTFAAHPEAPVYDTINLPCRIGGYSLNCVVDTGDGYGFTIGTMQAHLMGIVAQAPIVTITANGLADGYAAVATITARGRTVAVAGEIVPGFGGSPLLGLPALQALAPGGVAIRWGRKIEFLPATVP